MPEELIRQESDRIARDLHWQAIADEAERARRLRRAAEQSAIDAMLIAQAAANDPRLIEKASLDREVRAQTGQRGCRNADDEASFRDFVEGQLRVQRLTREMVAGAPDPSPEEVEAFYNQHRERFQSPDVFHAAHIVKHAAAAGGEELARAGIEAALAELERGEPFAEVAQRYSDCKDNGGDLGRFPSGHMVQEFEDAIRALEPGQRTGVFRTAFGFHIAELRARIPAGPAAFEDVSADIKRVFMMRNEHALYLRAVAELRSRADIRFVEPSRDRQEAGPAS
ncbi:MAG: peptidylprolyl isomerase [Bryobacteraceae bacterium]